MAAPTPSTATGGQLVTSTFWNTEIRDIFNYLLNPPRCLAHRSADKSTATATWVLYDMNAELYDPFSTAMHDNTTNNSRIVAPDTAIYAVFTQVTWAATSGGIRAFDLRKNAAGVQTGGTRLALRYQDATGGSQLTAIGAYVETLMTAGDYVELFTRHEQGAALNVDGGIGETYVGVSFKAKQ